MIVFSLFISNLLMAQVPPLKDHVWKLEKIVTVDSTLVVPTNIYFSGNFFDTFYVFGNCSTIGAETAYNDASMSFNSIFPSYTFPVCPGEEELMDIEDFFMEEFFFIDTNQMTTHDPFFYQFSTTTDKIYLDITNNVGSVATFYDDFLSQQEFLENSISVYPNPAKDKVSIDTSGLQLQKVSIFDLQGRLVLVADASDKGQIDVSPLSNGIYILQIETNQGILSKKLVKTK